MKQFHDDSDDTAAAAADDDDWLFDSSFQKQWIFTQVTISAIL